MSNKGKVETFEVENKEWLESFRWVQKNEPKERVRELLGLLQVEAQRHGISFTKPFNTPHINSISQEESAYPGGDNY